jgi:NAD+ synthase
MDKEIQLINGKLQIAKSLTQKQHDAIIDFIKDFFKDKKGPSVLGVSGGKDSTICAALLAEALGPERVIGVLMPNGEQKDIDDSKRICELLKITPVTINIGSAYDELTNQIECYRIYKFNKAELPDLYTTNTPARLRMTTLYGIAAVVGGFVCNTCNYSEDFVGYSSKYGDCCGDFSLLNQLTKTEVVALGDYMKLPAELVHKTPSDGMCGATDEDNMGFTYDELDTFIRTGLKPKSIETYNKIKKMHLNPNTKLKLVPMAHPELDLEENWEFGDACTSERKF